MLVSVLLLVTGLVTLVLAGDRLVRSAGRLALLLGMPPIVIGATVVAFGTSMPEFTVSVIGAIQGASGVAAGNVVGSNIINIFAVLGFAALISPIAVHRRMLRFDIPVLVAVTGWALFLLMDGVVTRIEGGISVVLLFVFSAVQLKWFGSHEVQAEGPITFEGLPVPHAGDHPRAIVELPLVTVAVAVLAAGSWLFVRGATDLAERAGISEFAIGATVVALGTSLPELVTSVIAAWKREDDIAIGNVVGSNLFNILGVLGGAALARPVDIDLELFQFELPVMAVAALVLVPLAWPRLRIGRIEGGLLVVAFIAYTALTLIRGS
ncbi:MAG: calcium/sodium antiporter [Dehalococcoidia bacterium]|nr:calcium/sodium antiporter [Dehalococcoidia bacterium]